MADVTYIGNGIAVEFDDNGDVCIDGGVDGYAVWLDRDEAIAAAKALLAYYGECD